MTDKEIMDAMYECSQGEDAHCSKCVYAAYDFCHMKLYKDALGLINRQRARNKQLRDDLQKHMDVEEYLAKLTDEQQAEIERLQADIDKLQEFADALHLSTIRLYDIEVVPFDSVKNWAKTFGIKMIGGSDVL